jgi:hypothetical protein
VFGNSKTLITFVKKKETVMKKALVTIIITLFSIAPSFAQDRAISTVKKAAVEVIDSTKAAINSIDTSSNFKMVYEDARAGLIGLAKALRVGVEHVYVVLVRQQLVKSITGTFIIGLLVLFAVLFFTNLKKAEETGRDSYHIKAAIFGILGGAFLLYVLMSGTIPEVVTGYVNPEYGAMESIFDFVKRSTK